MSSGVTRRTSRDVVDADDSDSALTNMYQPSSAPSRGVKGAPASEVGILSTWVPRRLMDSSSSTRHPPDVSDVVDATNSAHPHQIKCIQAPPFGFGLDVSRTCCNFHFEILNEGARASERDERSCAVFDCGSNSGRIRSACRLSLSCSGKGKWGGGADGSRCRVAGKWGGGGSKRANRRPIRRFNPRSSWAGPQKRNIHTASFKPLERS